MKRKMTLISIKHRCVCTGNKASAKMETTVLSCMSTSKKSSLCVNTLKSKVIVTKVISVSTNTNN